MGPAGSPFMAVKHFSVGHVPRGRATIAGGIAGVESAAIGPVTLAFSYLIHHITTMI